MFEKKLSRREFLTLTTLTAAGTALAACAQPTPAPTAVPTKPPAAATAAPTKAPEPTKPPAAATAGPTKAPAKTWGEAPMLAEQVKAGKLPAANDRLPANPVVIKPVEKVGEYGNTLNRGTQSISGYICTNQAHEPLVMYSYPFPNKEAVVPNLAEKFEFSADGKTLTIALRKGIKWSDGQPFTAEDVMFYWEDVLFTKESLQAPPGGLFVEGKIPPKIEMVDQYTLKFSYEKPMYYFINTIASVPEAAWPKHYMKQFHPKYNKDATWEIFTKNVDWWAGRGKVVLQGWMLEEFQAGKFLKMIRNPYYFKVDTSGNQLPYIDRITWTVIEDRPTIALKCVAGEIDLDGMWVGIPQIPLFFEEKPKRGFDLGWYENVGAWSMYPNMDHPDAVVRAALRDLNFRKAISLAINRKEINKTFYYDLLDISNNCFAANNPGYDKALTTVYSEFNPTEANKILDTAGYKDINNDKFRESPDGKPLALVIDVYQHDLYVPMMEMVVEQLKAVGIKATLNIQQQDAIFARLNAFEFQLTVGDYRGANLVLDTLGDFIPISDTTPWWHNKGSKEPFSPEFKKFAELLSSAKQLPFDKMVDVMKQANKIYTENVFSWTVGTMKRPYFIGKGVYNVPKAASRVPADTPPLMLYQVYIKR